MANPFDQFDAEPARGAANPFDAFDDAGFFSGTVGSVRRGFKQAQQQVNALGVINRSDWQQRQLADAERLEQQADAIDALQPNWSPENRAAWAARARDTAKAYRERASTQPEIILGNLQRIGALQSEMEAVPQSAGKREYDEAQGLGAALGALARHPLDVTAGVAAESIPASVPSLVAGALGSAAGPAGTAAGAGVGSLVMEYGGAVLDSLQSEGVDINRPETLAPLLNDPAKLAAIREHAIRRGVPVALFDAVSAGIAGRLLRAPAKTMAGKLAQVAGEIGIQGALGGAGEAAGALAAGDAIDPKAVLGEILGEVGSGAGEVATGAIRDRALGASQRDTGQNVPESRATLEAQQEQLLRGLRPAQMFPLGTEELPLPKGMQRVETERGVFHFNPQLTTADEIFSATKKARENDVLNLGSQSKADVDQRVAATGEQRVAVVERTPEGTEVRTAVATEQSAPRTLAEMSGTKTPGNVIAVEPLGKVPQDRLSTLTPPQPSTPSDTSQPPGEKRSTGPAETRSTTNLVEELLTRQARELAQQREAEARELLERAQRQQELAAKRARFDERLAVARDVMSRPEASYAEVNGALESVKHYAEDNSLGLAQEQRELASRAAAALAQRVEGMKAAEQARRDAEQRQREQLARAEELLRREKLKAESSRLKAEEAAGIGANGAFDYTNAPMAALEQRAEQGDQRAIDAIARRSATEDDTREDLLSVLRSVKLPTSDAALGAELATLVREHMTPQQRLELTSAKKDSLDRTAEALRERGFAAVQTPNDVIDLVGRALRGEKIYAEPGREAQVDFATGNRNRAADEVAPAVAETDVAPAHGAPPRAPVESSAERISGDTGPAADRQRTEPAEKTEGLAGRPGRRVAQGRVVETHNGIETRVFPATEAAPEALRARSMDEIEAALRRGGIDRDRAARAVNAFVDSEEPSAFYKRPAWPVRWDEKGNPRNTQITREEAHALSDAVRAYDAGGKFKWPTPRLRELVMVNFAESRRSATAPALSEADVEREISAIRKAFPQLVRENDVQLGNVQRALQDRGYKGIVPPEVQAAVARLKGQRTLIVLSARAYRDRAKGAGLLTHEMAHPFWDTLPTETQNDLRELHAREVEQKTGPLYRDGVLQSDLQFVEDMDENGHKEWFAERIARLNEQWARGEIDRAEHSLLKRVAYQFRQFIRKVWAAMAGKGVDPEGELFIEEFRRFFESGGDLAIARRAGAAWARAMTPEFAQGLLALDTPAGVELPAEIRNLQARWQDKRLTFESNLDKALYYAGGTNSETRTRVVAHLAEQTGLTEGQIASAARTVRDKLAPIARAAAADGEVRVPALMREEIARVTGVEFATGKPEDAAAAQARYDALRDQFDQLSEEAEQLKAEITALEDGNVPGAAMEIRAKRDELRDNERTTKAIYAQLGALRQKIEQANPTKPKLPEGKTPDQVIAEAAKVESLPKVDRKAALLAELKRGRELRDEGSNNHNEATFAEGVRIAKLARERLDEEYPGWEREQTIAERKRAGLLNAGVGKETNATPPAEPAPSDESDREKSPFAEPEKEMPVRARKPAEIYGNTSYQPTVLARTWERVRDTLRGIKGAVPELPTFGAAFWNKSDSFIREHGPNFYDGIKAFYRKLVSANDGIQRQAEDDVAKITKPLLAAGGRFEANDYARMTRLQEVVRRLNAEKKPVPARVTSELAALNSKLESHPYVLFERLVLMLDLNWRQQNLKDSAGNAIALPSGINEAEIKAELQRLGERIAASSHEPQLRAALAEHMALVKRVAEDLKKRELMAVDSLQNPFYFPHLTLEVTRGGKTEERELRPARVKPGTEAEFRGYLIDPVGSTKAIETDYVNAMYYHLVQVGAHNAKADAVRDFARPYDIKREVEATAKQLAKERGVPVSWEQAFHEKYAPRGYVLYGTDSRDAFPSITVDRDKLARRMGVMLTSDDLQRQLEQLGLKGVKLLPEDLRETLQQGARETWIVPARVAEALRGIQERQDRHDNPIESALKWTQGQWKAWKLFMPQSHVRYEFGNVVGDLEKLVSASPQTFKYFPEAFKEVREFWLGGEGTDDLRAAVREGVINTITAGEMERLQRQPNFRAFETTAEKLKAEVKAAFSAPVVNLTRVFTKHGLIGRASSVEESAFREAVFRYAKFKGDLKALREGARPAYAGAYAKDIDAMEESRPGAKDAEVRKAAAISKATFGDYGDISVAGHWLREKLIPFYSWTEVNFKYHANLLRNLRDMVRAGEASQAEALKAGGRAAAVFAAGFTARAAGAVALRLALPYLAVYLWNNSGDRDDLEKELSEEDRRTFHIILGRDAQGKVELVKMNTAFVDVVKWFSGPKFAQAMAGWMSGKTDFVTAFSAWRDSVVPDFINNTVGQMGPLVKMPYTYASKKNPFPDVTDQRTIPAYDMRRVILSQATDEFTADIIERAVNKDYYATKDVGDWAKQLVLQVRQRDPEQWAFYAIKDKASDFLAKQTGQKRDNSYDAPDQQVLRNFRRAIYRGDIDKAVQFYQRLLDYGYTAERFAASIRAQDPLSELPKQLRRPFLESLTPPDRELLQRAYRYYTHINASKGHESQLFPHQRSGERGLERYRTAPREETLRNRMDTVAERDDDEELARAERALRESLRKRR